MCQKIIEFSEIKRKFFYRLLKEEIQNLMENKDFENRKKVIKNVVYWNEVIYNRKELQNCQKKFCRIN